MDEWMNEWKISICRRSTFWVFFENVKTKGEQLNSKHKKVWWEPVATMFTCADKKDQANEICNWDLAFISISIIARSIVFWLSIDYTVPKVSSQMVRWPTVASI